MTYSRYSQWKRSRNWMFEILSGIPTTSSLYKYIISNMLVSNLAPEIPIYTSKVFLLRWPCVSVRTRSWYLGRKTWPAWPRRESSSDIIFYIMLKPSFQHIAQRLIHVFFSCFFLVYLGAVRSKAAVWYLRCRDAGAAAGAAPCCGMLRPRGWPHLRQDVHSTKGEDEGCGNGRSAVDFCWFPAWQILSRLDMEDYGSLFLP